MIFSRCIVFLLFLALAGCGDEGRPQVVSDDPPEAESQGADGTKTETPQDGFPYKLDRSAKDVSGGWLLYVSENGTEYLSMIVALKKDPEKEPPTYAIAMQIPEGQNQVPFEVKKSTITDESIDVLFGNEHLELHFQGKLVDGMVFGNLVLPDAVQSARMIRPGEELTAAPQPHVIEGANELSKIFEAGGDWDKLRKFAESHPKSPLLPNLYFSLLTRAGSRELSAKEVTALLDEAEGYLSVWGARFATLTRINLVGMLVSTYYQPRLVETELEAVRQAELDPSVKERLLDAVERMAKHNQLSLRMQELADAPAEERDAKLAAVRELESEYLLDGLYLVKMARILEAAERPQDALDYYGRLVSVPSIEPQLMARKVALELTGEPPLAEFKRLWESVHGNVDGLEADRLQRYRKFLEETAKSVEWSDIGDSSQSVLVELYTGAQYPPCIAADAAFSIVKDHYADQPVSFLQYHVHVPGPDPMTNDDADSLFYRSRAGGTPALFVNRRPVREIAGGPQQVAVAAQNLQREIEVDRRQSHKLQVDVIAEVVGPGKLSCRANVRSEEAFNPRWRLHLVLAEREVIYRGANGIPIHEMVVRRILGPREGTAPQGSELTLEHEIDVNALRTELLALMQKFEAANRFKFDSIPLELKELVLVGFVTEERTERVLQSIIHPLDPIPAAN